MTVKSKGRDIDTSRASALKHSYRESLSGAQQRTIKAPKCHMAAVERSTHVRFGARSFWTLEFNCSCDLLRPSRLSADIRMCTEQPSLLFAAVRAAHDTVRKIAPIRGNRVGARRMRDDYSRPRKFVSIPTERADLRESRRRRRSSLATSRKSSSATLPIRRISVRT